MSKAISIVAIVVIIIGAGIITKRLFFTDSFDLPDDTGNTETVEILVKDGQVVDVNDTNTDVSQQIVKKEK